MHPGCHRCHQGLSRQRAAVRFGGAPCEEEKLSMDFLKDLASNYMLVCAVTGYFLAQILKIIIGLIRDRKLDMKLMFASGGMPSSHASTVAALCISCARLYGVESPVFAVTFVLASVVITIYFYQSLL